MFTEAYCIVSGRVQRVAYRDFAQHRAREHSVTGWAKNRDDGSVEIVAQGIPDDLKLFIEHLNEGSPLARVESVAVEWRTPSQHFDDFVVLY